jgi:hypothetical protein
MNDTRKTAEALLGDIAGMLGRKVGYGPGEWHVERIFSQGLRIVEMLPTGSGERHPFGERIRSAGALSDCLRFSISALSQSR